jgi:CheY-like chemotaxis protein
MPSVLIVEDDKGIRDMIQMGLELEGLTVATAVHGKDALDVLSKCDPLPSLILLDLMMPVMNGWQFIEAKKKDPRLSPIPVVVVSAFAERATGLDYQGLLKKPISLDQLTRVVRKYCPA